MNVSSIRERLRAKSQGGEQPAYVPPADLVLITQCPFVMPGIRNRVIARAWALCGAGAGPLTAWIVRREGYYFDGPGGSWDPARITYAACRDYLCWSLKLSERELWASL